MKSGELVDMVSEEFRPAILVLQRVDKALFHVNPSEPGSEEQKYVLNNLAEVVNEKVESEQEEDMAVYDFSEFENVEITGCDVNSLSEREKEVLYTQARYCQAMTDADCETMREVVSEDMIFIHMSGRTQSREEYFADVEKGRLKYYTIGVENPVIEIDDNTATISFTSVLNANAYGARGIFRMSGTHKYEKRDGVWIAVNN